jgi:hypothetical protein
LVAAAEVKMGTGTLIAFIVHVLINMQDEGMQEK